MTKERVICGVGFAWKVKHDRTISLLDLTIPDPRQVLDGYGYEIFNYEIGLGIGCPTHTQPVAISTHVLVIVM